MSDLTISFTDTLVVVTCWCGINHAVPQDLDAFQQRQHANGERQTDIYCPLGHVHVRAGKGEAAKLRERLEREEARLARTRAELDQTQASLRAQKGVTTKLRKRAANGVCPCCHRTFANVARHVKGRHPEYVAEHG